MKMKYSRVKHTRSRHVIKRGETSITLCFCCVWRCGINDCAH